MNGQAADTHRTAVSAADSWPVGRLLTAKEAARVAGVHECTIRRAIARGELAATKHARVFQIAPEALAQYRARRDHSSLPRRRCVSWRTRRARPSSGRLR
jgi:excisionase family DNA binding protein